MATYAVTYIAGAASYVYVEADSPEEARDRADDEFRGVSICAQCSGWGNNDQNLELGDFEQDPSDWAVFAVDTDDGR